MIAYQFVANGADGASAPERAFLCTDDKAAMAHADRMTIADGPTDVWQAARFVGRTSPESVEVDALVHVSIPELTELEVRNLKSAVR